MTGDVNQTLQLGNAAQECKPRLEEQFPWLKEIKFSRDELTRENIHEVMAGLVAKYGEWFAVYPLHPDDHNQVNPVDVVRAINPNARAIGINPDTFDLEDESDGPSST
jgi:hypothetical protein